ncbi:MAG: histidine kinase, partial [Salinirussus sp.]
LGGSVAGIGIFYGTVNPAVGWITHEFHSVVFGFAFVGVLSVVPEDWPDGYGMTLVVGLLWATFVWLVAASFVAPVWLQLSGVPVDVPNFSTRLLASHLVWGATLAITTALGYRTLQPRLSAFAEEDHFDRS